MPMLESGLKVGTILIFAHAVANCSDEAPQPETAMAAVVEISSQGLLDASVGLAGIDVLADGRLVLLNAADGLLIVGTADGARTDTIARSGVGPGEIGRNSWGWVAVGPRDSITVTDGGNRRILIVAVNGSGSRIVSPPDALMFGDAWIPSASGFVAIRTRGQWVGATRRDNQGNVADTLATILWSPPSLGTPAEPLMHIFGEQIVWAHSNGKLAIALNNAESILLVDTRSADTSHVPVNEPRRPVSSQEHASMLELWQRRAKLSDIPPAMAARIKPVIPTHFPSISSLSFEKPDVLLVQRAADVSELSTMDLTERLFSGFGGREWVRIEEVSLRRGVVRFDQRFRPIRTMPDGSLLGVIADSVLGARPAIASIGAINN